MTILHIGDLHFREKNTYDQNRIQKAFLEEVKKIGGIQLVFFSGDLVHAGENKKDFVLAHEYLLTPLLETLNLTEENLFLCQGNHDVDRTEVSKAVLSEFSNKKFVTGDEIERWYKTEKVDKEMSLRPSNNYFEYVSGIKHATEDKVEKLFSVHIRQIENKKIGIITINSAWFSADRVDKGELLFLPYTLQELISKIDNCDYKIFMQHHPLSFYKESLSFELQDLIHSNFNVFLLGHVHKEAIETHFKSNNGMFCNTTKAALCYDGGAIGFSVINVDLSDLGCLQLQRYHYIKTENTFNQLETVVITIPIGEEKHRQNLLRKKITSKYTYELDEANQLLLDYNEEFKTGFIDNFTEPVLSKKSDEESSVIDLAYKVHYNEIKSSKSYLVFGKDKCGKTSILKKLLLDYLHDYSEHSIVPFYIDYKEIESLSSSFDIIKALTQYYSVNRREVDKVIKEGRLVLLIDNLNASHTSLHSYILEFLIENPGVRFIACSEYLTSRIFSEDLDGLEYEKIFFKNLSRTDIRKYAKKIPSLTNNDYDIVIDRVVALCKQLQLPSNFWTISLIILIYKKTNEDYTKNLFSVLDVCVDEILQKRKYAFEKNDLKFEQYKSICSEVAYKLFKYHKETEYSAPVSTILSIMDEYIDKNKRIVLDSHSIFTFLLDSGLFKKKHDNNFTFRLNGLFEYFLAYKLKENDDFRNEILSSDTSYLQFKNELEIYAGLNRSDSDFLRSVYKKTKDALSKIDSAYGSTFDKLLNQKIELAFSFEKEVRKSMVSQPLDDKQRDELYDTRDLLGVNADVHRKEELVIIDLDVEIAERYLSVLGRVFKNLDAISNPTLVYEIFSYLLDIYCKFGFYLIDEYKRKAEIDNVKMREEHKVEDDFIVGEDILKLLSKIVPVLVQTMFFESIGHSNFRKIVEDRIATLRIEKVDNQLRLFILYFFLIDLDVKQNKNFITTVFDELNLAPLKVSTLFKLNFYLAFKAYNDKTLEQFIKNQIQIAEKRIDGKKELGEIQKAISRKSKRRFQKRY